MTSLNVMGPKKPDKDLTPNFPDFCFGRSLIGKKTYSPWAILQKSDFKFLDMSQTKLQYSPTFTVNSPLPKAWSPCDSVLSSHSALSVSSNFVRICSKENVDDEENKSFKNCPDTMSCRPLSWIALMNWVDIKRSLVLKISALSVSLSMRV